MDGETPLRRWLEASRFPILVLIVLVGLGVAAIEKWRQDQARRIWSRATMALSYGLDPIRDRTRFIPEAALRVKKLWGAEQDNKRLREELLELRLSHQQQRERLGRLQRLSGLGQWAAPAPLQFVQADVTGFLTMEQSSVLTINRGARDGVHPRDPVVALGGLVGIVRDVTQRTATVQELNDPLSAVGVVERKSRARGVVYGRGRTAPLEFLPESEVQPIEIGAELITSGFENSVYPRGIAVGRVVKREVNSYGIPYGKMEPSVSLATIEEVLVITRGDRPAARELDDTTATLGNMVIEMPEPASRPADGATTRTAVAASRPAPPPPSIMLGGMTFRPSWFDADRETSPMLQVMLCERVEDKLALKAPGLDKKKKNSRGGGRR